MRILDSDLKDLARTIAEMGGLAEKQMREALEALNTRDSDRASWVISADAAMDLMQRATVERTIETIARRQPVANDLRQIVGILRIAYELERIGDLAKNVCKRILAINQVDIRRGWMRGVNQLAVLVQAQCRDALDSFANHDALKALSVWTRDEDADRLCTRLFSELLVDIIGEPARVPSGIHLLFCTKNLERMGDHATNIAEAVHYMVDGRTRLGERPKADGTSMIALAPARAATATARLHPAIARSNSA